MAAIMTVMHELPMVLMIHFQYDYDAQLLLCRHCKCALLPSSGARHITRKLQLPSHIASIARSFLAHLPSYTTDSVPLRPDLSLPVPDWPIHDGFRCRQCSFASRSRNWVLEHIRKLHGKQSKTEESIETAKIQAWFANNRARYWRIEAEQNEDEEGKNMTVKGYSTSHDDDNNDLAVLLQKERDRLAEVQKQREIIGTITHSSETDEWYIRTEWKTLLEGRTYETLAAASVLPYDNEQELQWLCKIFDIVALRSMNTLRDTPREVLRWLHSPRLEDAHPRPFTILRGDGTVERYLKIYKRFLCYCFRTSALNEVTRRDEHGIIFTEKQAELIAGIWKMLEKLGPTTVTTRKSNDNNDNDNDNDDESNITDDDAEVDELEDLMTWSAVPSDSDAPSIMTILESGVMSLCINIVQHRFRTGNVHESPLIFFTAILGIDENRSQLRRPETYTYYLSPLVWVNRLLLLEYALPLRPWELNGWPARDAYDDYGARLKEIRAAHLVDGSFSPQSEILSLLAYGKKVTKAQGGRPMIIWSKDGQTMHFRGSPITMDGFRGCIRAVLSEAETLLTERLMFGDRTTVDLDAIIDSMVYGKAGWWFKDLPANQVNYDAEYLLHKAATCPDHRQLFRTVCTAAGTRREWHEMRRKRYLREVQQFKEKLFILMHGTGGQPGRGPEIGTITYRNSGDMQRNVYILDGVVMFNTEYDKNRDMTMTTRYVARWLPRPVGVLLMRYLIYVLPFADMVANTIRKTTEVNDCLFGSPQARWTGRKLSRLLQQTTRRHLGVELGIAKWRQVVIGIAKKHLSDIASTMARYNFDDDVDNSDSEEEEDDVDEILHQQAGHSRTTGVNHYGLDGSFLQQLQPERLSEMRRVSERLQRFLGFAAITKKSTGKRRRTLSMIDQVALPASKASTVGRRQGHVISASNKALQDEMRAGLICLYGYDSRFRSDAQEVAATAVLRNEKALIIVMGTAMGKSLLFQLPAVMSGAGTVVVVVPFRALVDDLVHRCVARSIDAVEWSQGISHPHAMIIVSADVAILDGFMMFVSQLHRDGLLRHIFIDECHVSFTDVDYREALRTMSRIRDIAVPITLLTATLPPILEWDLRRAMLVMDATLLRNPTYRSNISYRIVQCKPGKTVTVALQLCQEASALMPRSRKGIVYCRSRAKCKSLASLLSCSFYFAESESNTEALRTWLEGDNQWITATGSLGTGVNLGNVDIVVHVDRPYGLIDYIQQSGRGGRSGRKSIAYVVIDPFSVDMEARKLDNTLNEVRNIDERALQDYLTIERCRRVGIGEYADGAGVTCQSIDGIQCDFCRKQAAKAMEVAKARQELAAHRSRLVEEATEQERLEAMLDVLSDICIYCLQAGEDEWESHRYVNCLKCIGEDGNESYVDFQAWRRQLRFSAYSHCYWCGLPQTICHRNNGERDCQWPDVVLAVIFCGLRAQQLVPFILHHFRVELQTEQQLLLWLVKSSYWNGADTSHIMMVFKLVSPKLMTEVCKGLLSS